MRCGICDNCSALSKILTVAAEYGLDDPSIKHTPIPSIVAEPDKFYPCLVQHNTMPSAAPYLIVAEYASGPYRQFRRAYDTAKEFTAAVKRMKKRGVPFAAYKRMENPDAV